MLRDQAMNSQAFQVELNSQVYLPEQKCVTCHP